MTKTNTNPLNVDKTNNGLAIVRFRDDANIECSLQESSFHGGDGPYIWLGYHHGHRMHLTQEMVRALLPYLNRFIDVGEI